MKLSSAFDQTLLLSGCTGKTSPATGEVAAVTGTQMAYLDKTNEMKTVQNSGEVPDVQFNGVFSLTDDSGVNTIAYGGSGTVYGCFNYSNENIASYSKSYQGSSIFSSAFAVAGGSSAQAEALRPDLAGAQISSPHGIMVGATSEALHAYSTDESAEGTWNRLSFDPEGRIGSGDSANLDEIQIHYVKSAGDRFFAGTSKGLVTFLASGISLTTFKITGWELLNGIEGMPNGIDEVRSVDFIREISLKFPETSIGAYAMSYWKDSVEYVAIFAPKSRDDGWNCTLLEWKGTGVCTDAECVSEATFQELLYTKSHPLDDYPINEDIPWIDSEWVSIRPQSKVGSEWNVVDLEGTQSANSPIPVDDLKLKMPNGYAVLAKGAARNGNTLVIDAPEGLDDYSNPALYVKVERQDGNFWQYTQTDGILQNGMPLPVTLENGRLYKVVSPARDWPSRWIQDYVGIPNEGAAVPSDGEIDSKYAVPEDWTCPADAVQLWQSAFADADCQDSIRLTIDISEWLDRSFTSTQLSNLQSITVCIGKDAKEFETGTYVSNALESSSLSTKYWTLDDSGRWIRTSASISGNAIQGLMDADASGEGIQFYSGIRAAMSSEESSASMDFGYGSSDSSGTMYCLNASASYDRESRIVTVDIRPAASGINLDLFDKTVKIKIAAACRRSSAYLSPIKASAKRFIQNSTDKTRWEALYGSSSGNPSFVSQRVIYSSSGIVSEEEGRLVGGRITANLAFANGSNHFRFFISNRDAGILSILTGRGISGGAELHCTAAVEMQGSLREGQYSVGSAYLSANGVLSFAKRNRDGGVSHSVAAASVDSNGAFVPKTAESGEFKCSLHWTKEGQSPADNASGKIVLSVPEASVLDAGNWSQSWTTQFEDLRVMDSYSEGFHMFLDESAYLCTDASAEGEEELEELSIKGDNLLRYGFRSGSSGGVAVLSSQNGNASASITRFVHVDAASNGKCLICGPTLMWEVNPSETVASADGCFNNAENQIQCLSFRTSSGASDRFYHVSQTQIDGIDKYFVRECYAVVNEDVPYLCIEGEVFDSLDSITVPKERIFSGTIGTGMPVWIDERLHWLELGEDDNELGATLHPLHWAEEPGQTVPSALAAWNSGPVFHLTVGGIANMTAQNPSHLPLQLADSLKCLARFRMQTPAEGEPLEWKWKAYCIQYSGNDAWVSIGDKWVQYFSSSDAWRTEVLSGSGGMPFSFSFGKVRSEGSFLDALSSVCIQSGSTWKMLERGGSGIRFSPIAFYTSIPDLQRNEIGQLYFNASNLHRIIQYDGTASSIENQRWTLYEQALDSESEQGWKWQGWPSNMYDSMKIYAVTAAGGWPQFNPEHGAVYFARTNHLTGDANRYSSGYYIYVADGSSLSQSYRKLPYLSDGESGGNGWKSWIGNDPITCLVLVGRGSRGGEGNAAKLRFNAESGWILQEASFGTGGWISFGPFQWTSGANAIPALKSRISMASDTLKTERPVYACFAVPVDDGTVSGRTAMIAVKKSLSFSTPRIVGLFQNEDGTSTLLAASDPLDSLGSARNAAVVFRSADIWLNGAQFVTMSVRPVDIPGSGMNWVWEAALNAQAIGGIYAVGAYGTLNIVFQNNAPAVTGTAAFIYANSVKTSTDNAAGILPYIHSPEADSSEDSAESDIVLWNDEGFYVSLKRQAIGGESPEPLDLEGSSSLAEKHAIVDMTAFKAYNAPIILGLYEKSGLILYYGRKCFDQSILSERIRDFNAAQDDEDSIGRHMLEAAESIVGENPYSLAFSSGRTDILDFIRSWMPDTEAACLPVVTSLTASMGLNEASRKKIAKSIFTKTAMSSPTAAERNGWNAVAEGCAERQAKERMMQDLDCRLAQSYEYSPNNSSESQWVDIPILVKRAQGNSIVYEEPSEPLTTLTTAAINGRIRVSVGSSTGNVYWRDLNPLHADRFISYIPTALLSPAEQNAISSAGVRPGNERLKELILGRGTGSAGSEARTAWTQEYWEYTGSSPVANQNFFAAERGSKASIAKSSEFFLTVNGTKTGIPLSAIEAKNIADTAKYDPFVYTHTRNWMIGAADTGISVYANAPIAKMSGGKLIWFAGGTSTGIQVKKNVYPRPASVSNKLVWMVGETATSIAVKQNGNPYVKDGVWVVKEVGKASPTVTGILDTGQGAASMGGWIDVWRIHPTNSSEGRTIDVATETARSASTKFGTYQKSCWALSNVTQIGDNGAAIGSLVSKFVTKHEALDGETAASCPYVLRPAKKLAIGTFGDPQWSSKGSVFAACSHIMINGAGRIDAVDATSGDSIYVSGSGRCVLGSTGREFWVLPNGTSGPWCDEAQPTSTVGTRWEFTKIDNVGGATQKTWDSFQKVSGKWKSYNVAQNASPAINSAGNWSFGSVVPTDSSGAAFKATQWQKPVCKQSIRLWAVGKDHSVYVVRTGSACPYKKAMEVCAWRSDTITISNVNVGDDPILKRDFSSAKKNWIVNGQDTGIPVRSGDSPKAFVQWTGGEAKFVWNVIEPNGTTIAVAETSSPDCPVTAGKGTTWWIQNNGKWQDTKIAAGAGVYAKGLESDGISSMPLQRMVWNAGTRSWESTPAERTSWTPLASLFIDAYEETSRGVISSIRNPYVRYEGRLWECETSEELFDEEDVHISDSQTTSWDAYQESPSGNKTNPSFTVYVGWKEVPNSELFDSFCTVVSDTTGTKVKWSIRNKEWKLLHCELVTDSSGMLTNIVLMASRGWIVSTSIISFENGGRDIKTIVWQNAVNPVQTVLQELEKIVAYQWNSWTSNSSAEFAAVGTSGIYVYSPDCIHFEASQPYGESARLEEIVWDEAGGEFKINGTAPTYDDGTSEDGDSPKTMTVEYAEGTSGEIKFEDEYKNAASEGGGGSSSGTTSDKSVSISTTDLQPSVLYKHSHKNYAKDSETLYYAFSPSLTSFTLLDDSNLSASEKSEARTIVPDTAYKFITNGKTWLFTYSKTDSKGTVLGSGYSGKTNWTWKWTRREDKDSSSTGLSYITISKNTKDVAYGFPDLVRFIKSYKNTYRESMEFMGGVSTFISSERESVDSDRRALMESYRQLAEMGSSGLEMYSPKLMVAYKLYLQAKKYRDNSHYAENDCWDTWLQKIGMSLALEHKNFFNRAKRALWTAQAFRNHYEKLAKKGK